ncbi:MAG: hypothetical protein B9S33_18915 [Pedosphaera sp. Tous-C6FEB]|nr:MAG: hypothetical protein B9S33_18915 [Pedosphaera sp. Tous-C6FEB]
MAANSKKRAALDTNVLMDLARRFDFAQEFRETFQRLGYELWVPPTVSVELDILSQAGDRLEREAATTAIRSAILQWRCRPFPLNSVHHVVADRFAERLIERGLLPEAEVNDALILAESSLFGLPLLVSSDNHLLGIDSLDLKLAFDDADLEPVAVASPRRLLKALR